MGSRFLGQASVIYVQATEATEAPSPGWGAFVRNHAPDIAAMDSFVAPTKGFDLLYAFVVGGPDQPIAPAPPRYNAFAERLIGSIRRECVDGAIVLAEALLRRIL